MWSFRSRQSPFLVGLDLGTTKVCCIIGEVGESGHLHILGVGASPSEGMRRGEVIHLEQTAEAVRGAIHEAEITSGLQVQAVLASIAGPHIQSATGRGAVRVARSDCQITTLDRDRALESATIKPRMGEIIHTLPQAYRVDGLSGIQNPIGLSGIRLEAEVHVVTGATPAIRNIYRSILRAGVDVLGLVLDPLASSYAVITAEEREVGTLMLDIGGGTTDAALFYQGTLCHTGVIGLGGDNVTRDLAFAFRTTHERAEPFKRGWRPDMPSTVLFEPVAGRAPIEIPRTFAGQVIEARMEELFEAVYRQVEPTELLDHLGGGIVLTGGGSLLWRCAEIAEDVFRLPATVRAPEGVSGLSEAVCSPVFSTGVGILRFAYETQVGREPPTSFWWNRIRTAVGGMFS